jgi:predicted phosphodiesterase
MRLGAQIYEADILSMSFASHLDGLVRKADVWVQGHTHTSMDYMIDKCRVVCNPC